MARKPKSADAKGVKSTEADRGREPEKDKDMAPALAGEPQAPAPAEAPSAVPPPRKVGFAAPPPPPPVQAPPPAPSASAPGPERAVPDRPPPPFSVNAQYTKDLSFEVPAAPNVFGMMQSQPPDISINIDVRAQPLQQNAYEVTLNVHARCQVGETVAFILELAYAGLFTVNVPKEQMGPMLLIECPRLLFPFARNIIADVSRDGGFPPLMLGPVDFAAMYRNQLARARTEAQAAPAGAASQA